MSPTHPRLRKEFIFITLFFLIISGIEKDGIKCRLFL